jgi:pimeloyl-ACP methyl ester carboxylesterase
LEAGAVTGASGTAVELHRWEAGRGQTVLCIHETAASSEAWRPLAAALGQRARTVAYDRRGWGRSGAPEPYGRTTVHEQAEDAVRVLAELEAPPAVVCGSGLGAVAALDLVLRRPELALAAILIEPPLLAFVEEATEALSGDGQALREAVHAGGPQAGLELYLSGRLAALGPGAERLPKGVTEPARQRPLSLFAELAAIPSWPLPLAELARNRLPALVVVSESSPALLRRAAGELTSRLARAELLELPGRGPAHLDDPDTAAAIVLELGAAQG